MEAIILGIVGVPIYIRIIDETNGSKWRVFRGLANTRVFVIIFTSLCETRGVMLTNTPKPFELLPAIGVEQLPTLWGWLNSIPYMLPNYGG